MNAQELIKIALVKRGLNERQLAAIMNDSPQNINRKIKSDMKLSFLESVADSLGYDLQINFIDKEQKTV